MIFAALSEAADRGELLLVNSGLCRFHRRKDGAVTVREIVVLPEARRRGVGRRLVAAVRARHPGSPLVARCPAASPSNAFWAALGFRRHSHGGGGSAPGVNVWRLDP